MSNLTSDLEIWKPIPNFENWYAISNQGRLKRLAASYRCKTDRVLNPGKVSNGYRAITLYAGAKRKMVLIHRMVLLAFVGPCPDGQQVNHKNGIKDDNRLENLEYVTPSENRQHAFDTLGKKAARGEQHGHSKLTEDNVREIRKLIGTMSYPKIAAMYGVRTNAIFRIANGSNWKWLK